MTEKRTKFLALFSAMLSKCGVFLLPTEEEVHSILISIKDVHNDDIDHSDVSQ